MTKRNRPSAVQSRRAAQAALATSRIMIGVGTGLLHVGTPLLPLALGSGASMEHFGCRLIRATYSQLGADGATMALEQLMAMLDDIKLSLIDANRSAPKASASAEN